MKMYLKIIAVLLLVSNSLPITSKENLTDFDNDTTKFQKSIWKQYKRKGVRYSDTIPFYECYIVLDGFKITYIKEGKKKYEDSLIQDQKYKIYYFKIHDGDVLYPIKENEILIKRYNNEGDYEYYRKLDSIIR